MSIRFTGLLAFVITSLCACGEPSNDSNSDATMDIKKSQGTSTNHAVSYPSTKRGTEVDTYHTVTVADPYRWLEDLDASATEQWVAEQNAVTQPYLESLPLQEAIKQRLTELWNYERFKLPTKYGDTYFFKRNDGLQDQDIVYMTSAIDGKAQAIIDPNSMSEDATVALSSFVPSNDGKLLAYSLSDGGSDWDTWHVRDTATGKDLFDVIAFTKFTSVSWLPDDSGFYYSRYPEKPGAEAGRGDGSKPVSIYLHKVGTQQSDDELVYSINDDQGHDPYGSITEDGNYLVASIFEGYSANAVHFQKLANDQAMIRLLDDWDAIYNFIGNNKSTLYFRTTNNAPNGRVIGIDIDSPEKENWLELVPESEDSLQSVSYLDGKFIANYLHDAQSRVRIFSASGKHLYDLELPGIGSVEGFEGSSEQTETFYSFTSFTSPSAIYHYNVKNNTSSLFKASKVNANLDAYETKQVFYNSKDGTRVPMFIVHHKDVKLDGTNPTMLYGYGGFDISITPEFSTPRLVWLEMGGILAIPNLRGGGEYGQAWHNAGTKLQKQNVFDDFIAAAEYLIANNYTSAKQIGISGRSNGGLLVGAATIQRPDLFGAALPGVGVLDMLRYHTPSANARAWSSDYGLSENEDEFKALHAYSPYHNVKAGICYPPTLVTTADHDDRVVPWHSFKYAAALQHAQNCKNPVLIRIETRAGHGAGKPIWMTIEDYAFQWAFLASHIGGHKPTP